MIVSSSRRLIWIGLVILVAASRVRADAGAVQVNVVTPRAEGYVIGDTITHSVRLDLPGDYQLDERSLPAAGRIDQWLELRAPEVRHHGHEADVRFIYQIVNAPDATRELVVPRQTLQITDAQRNLSVFIPEWRFTVTPIVPEVQRGPAARFNLRPERLPQPLPLGPHLWLLAALVAASLAAATALAWIHWCIPWRARRAQPFAHALRELRRLQGQAWDDQRQREAFRIVHRALDRAAGFTLLPSNVDNLFRLRPGLEQVRVQIESLLLDSRRIFFGSVGTSAPATLDTLTQLCRSCRDIERTSV
jgi:mxaA protein